MVDPTFEEHTGLLLALGCSHCRESSQSLVISLLGLQGKSHQI